MKNPAANFWRSLLHNRRHLVFAIFHRLSWIISDDELYLKIYYWLSLHKKLDINNPTLFNEKLQWLKLNDRRPVYTAMADKVSAKQVVSDMIGCEYVIPTLGVWSRPKDIDLESLPNSFVLKTNHDGGGNGIVICRDKNNLNKRKALHILYKSWRRSSYRIAREWPYKGIPRKVFAEPYLEDKVYQELRDYKFFCFDGVPKLMYIASERGKKERPNFDFYDMNFNHLALTNGHPLSNTPPGKPASFETMKDLASKLSQGIPFVRVDFYEIDGHPFFGEFTFYHLGGTGAFSPDEWNKRLGDWITLPTKVAEA